VAPHLPVSAFGPCRFVDEHECAGHWPENVGVTLADERVACPGRAACTWWKWGEGRDRQQAARAKRTVPLPARIKDGVFRCAWCTEPIVHGRVKQRGWHDGRLDEPNCAYEYRLHSKREVQFAFVVARDGLKCCDCGESPERWKYETWAGKAIETGVMRLNEAEITDPAVAVVGRHVKVERVTALELEHETPIWRTTHLPAAQRRWFFGPGNLKLRCPDCHKPKTKAEAAARAEEKRQARMRLDVPREEPRRKIQSRGFGTQHRKLRSRNTFATRKRP
jgi:hypothetical protein